MKHLLIKTLAGSGMLLFALTASAQYQPQQDYPYQDQREARNHAPIFDRTRADLDRAAAATPAYTADRDRLEFARSRVDQCQYAVASGEADGRIFGETIAAVQRVVDLNRLSGHERDLLADDVSALRDLQARLES